MSFLGMVPDQVREQAARCTDGANSIADLQTRLDAIVNGVAWTGPDREHFVQEWNSGIGPRMRAAQDQLSQRAGRLLEEAEEQDTVSDRDGDAGPFAVAGPLEGRSRVEDLFHGIGDWVKERASDLGDWLAERRADVEEWFGDRVDDLKEWLGDRKDDLIDWLRKKAHEKFGDPSQPDRPWAEIAAEELTDKLIERGQLNHRAEVDVHGSREVQGSKTPQDLADLILHNDETRRKMNTHPPRDYNHLNEAQIRIQSVIGEDGVERYIVHVPPTQGQPLKQNYKVFGHDTKIPDLGKTIADWDQQGQPFGWDNNLYAMAGKDNAGANAVRAAMEKAGVPPGSDVAFVAHSQGGLVASQLADDPSFNGGQYNVTDIFSVGSPVQTYTPAQAGTDVLNVQHVEQDGRKGDFVPQLDLEGSSYQYPDGNPSPQVKDVQLGTPESSPGFTPESDTHRAHESVQWNEDGTAYDEHSAYYGSVNDHAAHPDIAAKAERMRGKYFGDGTQMGRDVVVDVSRKPA